MSQEICDLQQTKVIDEKFAQFEKRFGKPGTIYFQRGDRVIYRNRLATVTGIDICSAHYPVLYHIRIDDIGRVASCARYELIPVEPRVLGTGRRRKRSSAKQD